MPTNRLGEFISRLKAVETKMDSHLDESLLVHKALAVLQADAIWIKRGLWAVATLGTVIAGTIATFVLNHLLWK